MEGASKCSTAAAVPVRTKIPEPMIAPIPSAVSDHGPSVFRSWFSGRSDSEISLSIDLQQRSWLDEPPGGFVCTGGVVVGGCAKSSPYHNNQAQMESVPERLTVWPARGPSS